MESANDTSVIADRSEIGFVKMHGIANDYVYVFDEGNNLPDDLSTLSIAISDRHCGVGGDGLVVISRSRLENADFRMRIFNADGSEAQMCGNASRCVAKYLVERGYTDSPAIRLETLAGIKILRPCINDEGCVESVVVDMGAPVFDKKLFPVHHTLPVHDSDTPMRCKSVELAGDKYIFNLVSMGNPHAVCFIEEPVSDRHILEFGPQVECHRDWPARTNVEFARVKDPHLIEMRVWERGSGETMACGTGACATAVAAISLGLAEPPVTVRLRGGDLEIEWDGRSSGHVCMKGGATTVAEGVYHYASERDNIWMHPRQ